MKRRQVMLGIAATAAIAQVPPAALAAHPTTRPVLVDRHPDLDAALEAVQSFFRTNVKQAIVLDCMPHAPYLGSTPEGLREQLYEYTLKRRSPKHWKRVHSVIRIKHGFDKQVGEHGGVSPAIWIREYHVTPRDTLEDFMLGGLQKLDYAAIQVWPHGYPLTL